MLATVLRCSLLVVLTTGYGNSYAASAYEQKQLNLVQQQLDTIKRLATQAEAANTSEPDDRYRFNYTRLIRDIQRISQGVHGYLSPSRAQPRDTVELAGDYRLDTPPAESSP